MTTYRKLISLDFDGVLHSYSSGWKGPRTIPDPPVPGAMDFLCDAVEKYRVAIYSSRSGYWFGRRAMRLWLFNHLAFHFWPSEAKTPQTTMESVKRAIEEWDDLGTVERTLGVLRRIEWPTKKPPAFLTIDDRVVCFVGMFPSTDEIDKFLPWNKKPAVAQ